MFTLQRIYYYIPELVHPIPRVFDFQGIEMVRFPSQLLATTSKKNNDNTFETMRKKYLEKIAYVDHTDEYNHSQR